MPAAPPLAALVRRIAPDAEAVPDAELLDRFAGSGDQAAFELLVWRHGAMVWAACRRMLGPDRDAAEDACQAAFVALATRAGRVRNRHALGAWLHRVAVRASLDLLAARRTTRPLADEHPAAGSDPARAAIDRETRAVLDAGLNELPEKLRVPFVLCELEGRSNAEAAAALGCPVGTVESRLTRARRRLRGWLADRGVTPAVAVGLPEAVRAAMVRAAGPAVAPGVRRLAARAVGSASAKLQAVAAVGLVLVASAVGFGLTTGIVPQPAELPKPEEPKPAVAERIDADEPQLPAGAITRLGSSRLRHGGAVIDLRFSPDGTRLVSCGWDNTVRVWDTGTGKQLAMTRETAGPFWRVRFTPDGKTVVAIWHDEGKPPEVWRIDPNSGRVLARFPLAGAATKNVDTELSPDGTWVAVTSTESEHLLAFDAANGREQWRFSFGQPGYYPIGFSADGRTLATCSGDRVLLFDPAGKPVGSFVVPLGEDQFVQWIAPSPDGGRVLLAVPEGPRQRKGYVALWDRATGKPAWTREVGFGSTGQYVFAPDGRSIVRVGEYPDSRLLGAADGKDGQLLEEWLEYYTVAAFRSDGRLVALGHNCGTLSFFDPATGKQVAPGPDPPREVQLLRFSPDGKTLFGDCGGWLSWDVATGTQRRLSEPGPGTWEELSRDGRLIVQSDVVTTKGPNGEEVDAWKHEVREAATGRVLHLRSEGGLKETQRVDFTPDAKGLIGMHPDGTVRVWAVDTGKELVRMTGHPEGAIGGRCDVSADGRTVVTTASYRKSGEDDSIRVWDVATGKQLAKFDAETEPFALAISADGRRVAASVVTNNGAGPDPRQLTTVWDVATGKVLLRVPQHGHLAFVTLSPDGRLLAVAGYRKHEVRVWDVAAGAERFVLRHGGEITSLAFAPNGRVLAAASKEAPVLLWDVSTERAALFPKARP
jgi:RNA polymerase sigma factor (sigma-70 family)